jgi:hypothetical protein
MFQQAPEYDPEDPDPEFSHPYSTSFHFFEDEDVYDENIPKTGIDWTMKSYN